MTLHALLYSLVHITQLRNHSEQYYQFMNQARLYLYGLKFFPIFPIMAGLNYSQSGSVIKLCNSINIFIYTFFSMKVSSSPTTKEYQLYIRTGSPLCVMFLILVSLFSSLMCIQVVVRLPQRLKSTFFEIFFNGAVLKGPAE